MDRSEWEETHQHFESGWWGDCANTYGEETKQIAYARVMGLDPGTWRGGDKWPVWQPIGGRILDVGGGPASMLLKCEGLSPGRTVVVDPCEYPAWTAERYAQHGIVVDVEPAEDFLDLLAADTAPGYFDEAWIYNVLQHTIDPLAIARGMCRAADRVRVFEWVDTERYLGHPHSFSVAELQDAFGFEGREVWLDEQYREIDEGSDSPVRQHAWGGCS